MSIMSEFRAVKLELPVESSGGKLENLWPGAYGRGGDRDASSDRSGFSVSSETR